MPEFDDLRALHLSQAIGELSHSQRADFSSNLPPRLVDSAKCAWKFLWDMQLFQNSFNNGFHELKVDFPLSGNYSPGLFFDWCTESGLQGCGHSGGVPPYFTASFHIASAVRENKFFQDGKVNMSAFLDEFKERIRILCEKLPQGLLYGEETDPTIQFPKLRGSGFGINAP